MARACTHAIAFSLACAVLCPAALAAEEEAPQTGTIEVEVVYKDTGEPVEGVTVSVAQTGGRPDATYCTAANSSEGGQAVFEAVPLGEYVVSVSNPEEPPFSAPLPYRFCPSASECEKAIMLAAGTPEARARFAVVRGWEVRGIVTRADRSPLAGALVGALESDDPWDLGSESRTDDMGCFRLSGIQPGSRIRLQVLGVHEVLTDGYCVIGSYAPVWRGEMTLIEEVSSIEIEVRTSSLEVTLDVVKPLWPFGGDEGGSYDAMGFWVHESEELPDTGSEPGVDLASLQSVRLPGLPKERYVFTISDLPADSWISFAMAIRQPFHDEPGFTYRYSRPCRSIALREGRQAIRFITYGPGARLSRAFWFGVPSLLVLAVFGTILIRQARRRRAAEKSG